MSLPIATERDEMRTLCDYLDARHILYCHVPNEQRHRRFGVKAGVPDILVFDEVKGEPRIRGVAIEIKRIKNSKVTQSQLEWQADLMGCGWECEVCYGAVEAIKFVESLWPLK
jgi:hypothetical protein